MNKNLGGKLIVIIALQALKMLVDDYAWMGIYSTHS